MMEIYLTGSIIVLILFTIASLYRGESVSFSEMLSYLILIALSWLTILYLGIMAITHHKNS